MVMGYYCTIQKWHLLLQATLLDLSSPPPPAPPALHSGQPAGSLPTSLLALALHTHIIKDLNILLSTLPKCLSQPLWEECNTKNLGIS